MANGLKIWGAIARGFVEPIRRDRRQQPVDRIYSSLTLARWECAATLPNPANPILRRPAFSAAQNLFSIVLFPKRSLRKLAFPCCRCRN